MNVYLILKYLYNTYDLYEEVESYSSDKYFLSKNDFDNFSKFQAFNPNNNEIKLYDYKDYSKISDFINNSGYNDLEVWTDSKALLLKVDLYDDDYNLVQF